MILEAAFVTVLDGKADEFPAAVEQGRQHVLARAHGFRGIELRRGIERPNTFLLLISWDTLEDHTEGFRGGPLFPEWRGHIGPFFAAPPVVEHWAAS